MTQEVPEDESARPSGSEASQGTPTVAAAAVAAKGVVRGPGDKPNIDKARVEEDERIKRLIQYHSIQDLLTFVSCSVDDPGWRSSNARVHAEVSGMNFSIAAHRGPAVSDAKRYTVWKPWLHYHEMLPPVQCPWTAREFYQAKFRILAKLRSWGTTFGRDEGLWFDIRMVIDELEIRA